MTDFYHDRQRDLLVYPSELDVLTRAIPEARRVNGAYVAVPRTLRNCQVLRLLQLPVPPIIDNYDWPHAPGITPYETQKLQANFMVLHPRCFNLSDMGVGKTLSALWASDYLMRQHPGMRTLIVAPLSILESVWKNAVFKHFLGRRTADIVYGDAAKREHILATSKADYLIINFDGIGIGAHTRKRFELDGLSRALAERQDIRIAIVDEASAYRDATTKRHRIARIVIGRRDYLWLMTGTPVPNAPTDAYGLAKMVNNALGKSFTTFRLETMLKISQFKWVSQRDGYDKAYRLLTPAVRIAIEDVWDGPP